MVRGIVRDVQLSQLEEKLWLAVLMVQTEMEQEIRVEEIGSVNEICTKLHVIPLNGRPLVNRLKGMGCELYYTQNGYRLGRIVI